MKQLFDLHDSNASLHNQYLFDKRKEKRMFQARARRKREELEMIEKVRKKKEQQENGIDENEIVEEKSAEQIKKESASQSRDEELQQLLHKAHDHMLVRVPAVKGNELYCVECRRIQIEYTKRVRSNNTAEPSGDLRPCGQSVHSVEPELDAFPSLHG